MVQTIYELGATASRRNTAVLLQNGLHEKFSCIAGAFSSAESIRAQRIRALPKQWKRSTNMPEKK